MTHVSPGRGSLRILSMNRGSSSLKAAIYRMGAQEDLELSIQVERAESSSGGHVTIFDSAKKSLLDTPVNQDDTDDALNVVFDWLETHRYLADLAAAGHRIVHGGAQFTHPERVTPDFLAELETLVPLDPDHLPEAMSAIRFISHKLPELPQIACFDTAFHSGLPTLARMYALPRRLYDGGVRRYGFHGLSYEFIVGELRALDGDLAGRRVIIAHLGSGASMVALRDGKPVDTSMGFTPLEGLVMGTRSGDVDPGALLYLLEQGQMAPKELSEQLNKRSGLLGVSGSSSDMRDLLDKSSSDPQAAQAVDLFCYRARKYIGAYAAALGGLDLLVFTGGIGERAAPVRKNICAGLEFLGIQLDPQRNQSHASLISRADAPVKVRVIETKEDLMVVRHVIDALGCANPGIPEVAMFIFDPKLSSAVGSPVGPASAPAAAPPVHGPLSPEVLDKMHRYWQAANFLTVGQIYLQENPLLREPLLKEHIKPRLLGHWGTSTGLSFIYVHLNRLIVEKEASVLYIAGPGHGGPALNANSYLEGTYSAVHQEITQDVAGIRRFFRAFSTPGGVPSHCGPHLPNSIHEGGELGYALMHAFGAAFDNPDLIVACVIGDGEAETCPLEGSWKSNRFLNPARDGAVLPILHLNGYKISGPTVEARTQDEELTQLYLGRGYKPYFVEGDDPQSMHQKFAAALDTAYAEIRAIQQAARKGATIKFPLWPMIVFRSPKGWTGPKEIDGVPIEGTFRAHQVPLATVREDPRQLQLLEEWMRSYHPEKLFDSEGNFDPVLQSLAPQGPLRMGANPSANGGRILNALALPDFVDYALDIPAPGCVIAESPRKLGEYFRDVIKFNPDNFRLFCPDETNSNRLNAVFEVTDRCSTAETIAGDDHVSPNGRVMEVLSEHCCEGWLEGYLLTGRHGVWATYEGFAQVVDSMLTQHGKWLEQCEDLPWRRPVASLNVFLTSHCWRNDHNGFSHQAPGFVDSALSRRSTIIRVYYPPDANTLLSTFDHCLRTRNYLNLVTCGKQEQLQWLNMEQAIEHCSRGASRWPFASNEEGGDPDVILACVGDVPTLETVAAAWLLQKYIPGIKVRLVNIVDLTVLMSPDEHPHGMDALSFEALFTQSAPVIFAYHGYRWAIHSMIHGRPNEARFHVRGFLDRGSTTTPFDMVVRNKISRYHLVLDALKYLPQTRAKHIDIVDLMNRKLFDHHNYIREHFEDMPEISHWRWTDDFSESVDPLPLAKGQPRAALFTDG